ncbi:MAG: hypothetical protein AAF488_06670, partial [Planctomycetota bacterium]
IGALVGKADGQVIILDEKGRRRTFAEADLVRFDLSVPVPRTVELKAKRARARHLQVRRRAATKLVVKLEKAKPDARVELKKELEGYDEAESVPALDRALRSRETHLRDYAYGRLKAFESARAVVPLINYVLNGADETFRERAHSTAVSLHKDKTREVYEYVAFKAHPDQRVMAIQRIGAVGDPKSVPRLARMLTYVEANIRAQLVRAKPLREEPISLSGATNVTIDLPEVELIEVMTTARVPVVSLQRVRGATVAALEEITGATYGTDVAGWKAWWDDYQAGRVATPGSTPPVAEPKGDDG